MAHTYSVYVHTTPSGKRYVGITGLPVLERWGGGNGYYRNDHFYRAIKKYGWDCITHEVISEGLTKNKACLLEIELIAKYKSNNRKYGYNKSSGGEYGSIGYTRTAETNMKMTGKNHPLYGKKLSEETKIKKGKSVFQYTLDGEYIKTWPYIKKASVALGIDISDIISVCKHKQITAGGFVWEYNDGTHMEGEKIVPRKRKNGAKCGALNPRYGVKLSEEQILRMSVPVNQYSIDGVLIKRWKSISCAGRALGISRKNISGVCRRKHNTSGGFMWAYENDPVPVYKEPKNNKCVSQYKMDGTFVASYSNIVKASLATGIYKTSISAVCRGRRLKSTGGFIWRYGNDDSFVEEYTSMSPVTQAVVQYTKDNIFVAEYRSFSEASRNTGIQRCSISNVCKSKAKTAGGFKWEYAIK